MADKQVTVAGVMPIPPPCPSAQTELDLDSTRCTYHNNVPDSQPPGDSDSADRIAESDKEQQHHRQESDLDSTERETLSGAHGAPPDGGTRAWLVVLGAWCASFCGYGWINSELLFIFPATCLANTPSFPPKASVPSKSITRRGH